MNQIVDPRRREEWLKALEGELEKCIQVGKSNITVDYRSVSHSFPGGPHPDRFNIPLIAWDQLKDWANNHGWDVLPAPEKTLPEQQSTPYIRFILIGKQEGGT